MSCKKIKHHTNIYTLAHLVLKYKYSHTISFACALYYYFVYFIAIGIYEVGKII